MILIPVFVESLRVLAGAAVSRGCAARDPALFNPEENPLPQSKRYLIFAERTKRDERKYHGTPYYARNSKGRA